MTETDEAVLAQAMSRALHAVADDPGLVASPGLAARVQQSYGRRRGWILAGSAALVVAALAVSAVVVGGPSSGRSGATGRPTTGPSGVSGDLRAAIRDARFVRTLRFDGGALTIGPADSGPHVTEPDAINLFRTTGGVGYHEVQDVAVGYGTATLRPDLSAKVDHLVTTTPVWVVVFRSGGATSCPMMTAPPSPGLRPGRHVFLLDRNGTWAVDYVERGSTVCGGSVVGPTAAVATRYVSIPWTQVSRSGRYLTVRYESSGCTPLEGWDGSGSPATQELRLFATTTFRPMLCPGAGLPLTLQLELSSATAPVTHAPTGAIRSYTTDGRGGLDVYDGR